MLAYGRGRWAVSQKPKLIRKKKQQQQPEKSEKKKKKRKNCEICSSDEKKGKGSFPMQTIKNTGTILTLPNWDGAASQPTMIRIMNGAQTFTLSAFTSKKNPH